MTAARKTRPLGERLWAKVVVGRPEECWPFTGCILTGGYGQIIGDTVGPGPSPRLQAHRAAWEAVNGPVPAGKVVCHRCDNRRCCNPGHLFCGTHTENMADMVAKKRSTRHERHPHAKLDYAGAQAIRAAYAKGGVTQRELGNEYGVSQRAVSDVVRHISWAGPPNQEAPRPARTLTKEQRHDLHAA